MTRRAHQIERALADELARVMGMKCLGIYRIPTVTNDRHTDALFAVLFRDPRTKERFSLIEGQTIGEALTALDRRRHEAEHDHRKSFRT